MHTGRPVKLTLSRAESLRFHVKRHPLTLTYTVGCDSDGRLLGLRARIVGDTGAYASVGDKVLERAAGHACGVYKFPAVDIEARAVYTNNPPCGAMRGFGANQSNFAIEGMLDRLAERTGLDGWEIRWRNAVEEGDIFGTGQRLGPGVGIKKTLLAVRDAYQSAPLRRHRLCRQEHRRRQRPGRVRQGDPAAGSRRLGDSVPLLDRDGPGRAHGAHADHSARSWA